MYSDFDILRYVIAPIFSIILSIITLTILVSSYFLVFRIKRYINKSKFFLDYIKKLRRTIHNNELCTGHMHRDDISGSDLEQNKKMIYEMLTKFKTADLKDIIIGSYKEELANVSSMINYNYRGMKKNNNFLQFQRLFHVHHKGTTRLLFLNNDYISFYKIHRRYVEIGVIEKAAVEKFSSNFFRENLSAYYETEIYHLAVVYNLYFFNNNFIYKNVRNPNQELENRLSEMKPIYKEVIRSKNRNFNIYIEKNFEELLAKDEESMAFIKKDGLIFEPVTSKARARLVEETRQIREIRIIKKETKKKQAKTAKAKLELAKGAAQKDKKHSKTKKETKSTLKEPPPIKIPLKPNITTTKTTELKSEVQLDNDKTIISSDTKKSDND